MYEIKYKKKKSGLWAETWRRFKKNRLALAGLIVLSILVICAIFAPFLIPYDYTEQNLSNALSYPNSEHWFGTDNYGRDIFSRIIYGSRISLMVGLVAVSIAAVGGTILGAIAAFYNKLDNLIMRIMDIFMGVPSLLLAIAIVSVLGPGVMNLMVAVGISAIPAFARVARSSVLTVKEAEFIEAAKSIGASNIRIIFRHIFPNAFAPVLVQCTLRAANAIIWAASLSFLGLGIRPPSPEWGAMLSAGRQYLRDYWHMTVIPGLAIMITTYALNVVGDGLRDALDPRLKK